MKFIIIILFFSSRVFALVGIERLEASLYQKNLEYQSQIDLVNSKKSLLSSGYSGFYPSLNAVGGWEQSKTGEPLAEEKGYVGYLEGKFNLFKGSKDQAVLKQRQIDLKIAELELEALKRNQRLQLTEVISHIIYVHQFSDILKEELKTLQLQKQMAARKVSAGLTGPVDNIEFDLREQEIEIEIKQIEQLHNENHQKLTKMFGVDVSEAELNAIVFSNIDELSQSANQFNIDNNLTIKRADLLKQKTEFEKVEIKSDFMPSLDLTYAAGRLTPSEVSPIKFSESKYAVVLTIPLFSGLDTYYKNKHATSNVASAEKNKRQARLDVEAEFNILINKNKELVFLFEINNKKLVSSQKYFELTFAEYKRGIKNSPDLVGATERLFLSKKKKYELLKDLEILKVQINNLH